jgi:Glu-tRNA(Gln) amidotransferase subunit E-like FAD-binding protein
VREERYAGAGVPQPVIHYLIRRGGALLVDAVVKAASADLKRACFFFGERIKGLRRSGVAVDAIDTFSWIDLFALAERDPVLWEAADELVRWMAENPAYGVEVQVTNSGLGKRPDNWRDRIAAWVAESTLDHPDGSDGQRVRFLLGTAMKELRGRVPAIDVEDAIRTEMGAKND